jgi:hypothetical protein
MALALVACSGREGGDVKNGGSVDGGAGSSGGAGEPASGGSASSTGGAGPGSGGSVGSSAGQGGGAATGGASGGSGASGEAGAGGELVSCDHRQVLCKSIEPTCPEMQVASVTESCWGPCVKIELCACSSAEECPHEESYTCWSKEHCGPYVR